MITESVKIYQARRIYKDYEISVYREGPTLFWWIERLKDGREMESSFAETTEDILTMVEILSRHVDDMIENPGDYE